MQTIGMIKGRVTGPTSIELDEPVPANVNEVEVLVRTAMASTGEVDFFAFLRALPAGTRSKSDIDAQFHADREGWDRR